MRRLLLLFFIIVISLKGHAEECVLLDLEAAWQRILAYAPSIAAADMEVCIREAEKKQVSLWMNPIAIVDAENLGVGHPTNEDEPPQTTFALSQTLELGGKRSARRELAASFTSIAYWDAKIERQNRLHTLITLFIEVKAAQEKLKLAEEKQQIADKILETIAMQVNGGKISPIQEKKGQIARMNANLSMREVFSELEQGKKKLASLWGSSCVDFDGVAFDLFECIPVSYCCVEEELFQTPEVEKAKLMIFSATKDLTLQKANRIPDLTLTLGYRVFNDSGQNGWVVGAAMPLPLFNKNQGNIQRACSEISQAEYQLEEVMRTLSERALVTQEKINASFEEAEMLRKGALVEAIETFNLTKTGYEKGKLEYRDLLEAQNMLFEIQEKYIDLLHEYHLNRSELARLFGVNYLDEKI